MNEQHVKDFLAAMNGGRGSLDAWLECNNEADCRAAMLGAIELEREACAKVCEAESVEAELTGHPSDAAYNMAIKHAAAAIRARGLCAPSEGAKE